MICPKCKEGIIKEQTSVKGFFIFKKKIVTYYCPLCSWENKREFELSKEDVEIERVNRVSEINIKEIEAQNKPKEMIHKTERTENRNYFNK